MKRIIRYLAAILVFTMLFTGSISDQVAYAGEAAAEDSTSIADVVPEEAVPDAGAENDVPVDTPSENKTDDVEKSLPEEAQINEADSVPLAISAGFLNVSVIGGKFVADQTAEIEVLYKPAVDGSGKYVEISGYDQAGLEVVAPPVADKEITDVKVIGDKIKVSFSDSLTAVTSISFRFQVRVKPEGYGEKQFVDKLDATSGRVTGILLKEHVGGTAYQTASSDFEISYTRKPNDIYNTIGSGTLGSQFKEAMALQVSAQDVDALDGSGWMNKEAKYTLGTIKYRGGVISDRYIKDLRVEMPLPNNITFIRSNHETEKDGIRISYDSIRNYLILECSSYYKDKPLEFTMTLNFQGLDSVAGVNPGRGTYYGVEKWHDFRGIYQSVPGRSESGRPWKLSGKMYGTRQEAEFYNRSMLLLNSLPDTYPDYFRENYKYSKPQSNVNIGVYKIGFGGWYRPGENGVPSGQHDFTRRVHYSMDSPIRIRQIEFRGSYSSIPEGVQVAFETNNGRVYSYGKADIDSSSSIMTAPECEEGDYIKYIMISIPGGEVQDVNLKADILDTDLNGNKLPYGSYYGITQWNDIREYGFIGVKSTSYAIYEAAKPVAPIADLRASGGVYAEPAAFYGDFVFDREYTNVGLISISNDRTEAEGAERQKLTDVSFDTREAKYGNQTSPDFVYPIFQLAGKSPATLSLSGYGSAGSLPEIAITAKTVQGRTKQIVVPASAFRESSSGIFQAAVDWGIPEDDCLKSYEITVSSLPVLSKVTLTADYIDMRNPILPDGTDVRKTTKGYIGARNDSWVFPSSAGRFKSIDGTEIPYETWIRGAARFYGKTGLMFSDIWFAEKKSPIRPAVIPQGTEVKTQFQLKDTAFNPVYAFEVDKRFDYMTGSFQSGDGKQFKFVEEWLPNYFKNTGDPARDGNGLLRIRFIGGKSQAYNLYPVVNSADATSYANTPLDFQMKFRSKIEANPGSYYLVPKLYRSDQWAIKELTGSKVDVKDCASINGFPGTAGRNPVEVTGEYDETKDKKITEADTYDIDGDGRKDTQICAVENLMPQQITKLGKTKVDGYLLDPVNGNEIRDAKLYPHQEFDFIQLMEVVDLNNYSDFVGYYHVPKKDHKIVYADSNTGAESTYVSQFDTYLKGFITSTVDGVDITDTGKIEVYYFVSDDPTDLDDGHNNMNELKDDGSQDVPGKYKTKAEIQAMVQADRTLEEILSNVTMIKVKASEVEANKLIKLKTRLAVGHKGGDIGELKDFFSGAYRYVTSGGTRIPTQYTPLMTFALMDYDIKGTFWRDKDANSLFSPKEALLKDIEVQLWSTGEDEHGGTTAPYEVARTTTDENGEFAFQRSYHGEHYLQFEIPKGMQLSLPNQTGGLPYEQSVFEKVTDPDTKKTYARVSFTLNDKSYPYQNAGLVDERQLEVPEDIYISVGETADLTYQIAPDYLMYEDAYKIIPTLQSDAGNAPYFTVGADAPNITGVSVGEGTITVSIPAAPLDGTTYITKTVTVHVEPASVASVSVPAKAEIYAVQGKTNEVIAPELTVHNYDPDPVKAYIKRIDLNNTGAGKDLKLVKKKDSYDRDEISLNVIPVPRTNPFSALAKTDLTQVEYIKGGLPLGTMEGFDENLNWGKFTFDGEYNPAIVSTNLEDNRFVMSYRFEKAGTP